MNDILDGLESKDSQTVFSKLSLGNSLLNISNLVYLFLVFSNEANDDQPHYFYLIGTYLFCFLGMIITIISFYQKERSTWFKWIGAIINFVIFSFLTYFLVSTFIEFL